MCIVKNQILNNSYLFSGVCIVGYIAKIFNTRRGNLFIFSSYQNKLRSH